MSNLENATDLAKFIKENIFEQLPIGIRDITSFYNLLMGTKTWETDKRDMIKNDMINFFSSFDVTDQMKEEIDVFIDFVFLKRRAQLLSDNMFRMKGESNISTLKLREKQRVVIHIGNAYGYTAENQEIKERIELGHGLMYLLDIEEMSVNQLGSDDPYNKIYLETDNPLDFLELPANYLTFGN